MGGSIRFVKINGIILHNFLEFSLNNNHDIVFKSYSYIEIFDKFSKKQLEFNIGDQKLRFNSVAEFEFVLEGRTSILTEKIIEMMEYEPGHLADELKMNSVQS